MKRQRCLGCLLASCVLILTACGAVQPVSGQVVERTTEEDGTLSAFVVETSTGERIGLTVTEKTRVFSWVDGVSGQDFAAGSLDGMAVSVVTGDPADLTANDGTDSRLLREERRRVIADAISSLREKERQVITLYYYKSMKYSDIAKVIGVSESRVCQINTKAMLALKAALEPYIRGNSPEKEEQS